LLAPADGDSVSLSTPITFVWWPSIDIENDTLTYRLGLSSGNLDTSFSNIQDTSLVVDGNSFLDVNMTYEWTVSVNDGALTTASPDTFSFFTKIVTGLQDDFENLPQKFALHQNFPNPFNPTTLIRYDLPQSAQVELGIYNVLGQEVRTLVNEVQQAGYKSVQWDATNNLGARVGSGIYIYRITAKRISGSANIIQSRKMLILK